MNRWLTFILLVLLALPLRAQPEALTVGSSGFKYLIIIDTSFSMSRESAAVRKVVYEMVLTGIHGNMKTGDRFTIWTFNDKVYPNRFPVQTWSREFNRASALNVLEILKKQPFEKSSNQGAMVKEMLKEVRAHDSLNVIMVSDGGEVIVGTPFDRKLNLFYGKHYEEFRKQGVPFITSLVAKDGELQAWSVSAGDDRIFIPPLDEPKKIAGAPTSPPPAIPAAPVTPPVAKPTATATLRPVPPAVPVAPPPQSLPAPPPGKAGTLVTLRELPSPTDPPTVPPAAAVPAPVTAQPAPPKIESQKPVMTVAETPSPPAPPPPSKPTVAEPSPAPAPPQAETVPSTVIKPAAETVKPTQSPLNLPGPSITMTTAAPAAAKPPEVRREAPDSLPVTRTEPSGRPASVTPSSVPVPSLTPTPVSTSTTFVAAKAREPVRPAPAPSATPPAKKAPPAGAAKTAAPPAAKPASVVKTPPPAPVPVKVAKAPGVPAPAVTATPAPTNAATPSVMPPAQTAVAIPVVPDPTHWPLLAAGIGLIGVAAVLGFFMLRGKPARSSLISKTIDRK